MVRKAKKNMQFRMKMFLILFEHPQLSTKQIFDKYVETNPRSVPHMRRFCQMLKCKWFTNIGMIDEVVKDKRNRYALWEINEEYRKYPPQWTPQSQAIIHQGGKENYSKDDFVIEGESSY